MKTSFTKSTLAGAALAVFGSAAMSQDSAQSRRQGIITRIEYEGCLASALESAIGDKWRQYTAREQRELVEPAYLANLMTMIYQRQVALGILVTVLRGEEGNLVAPTDDMPARDVDVDDPLTITERVMAEAMFAMSMTSSFYDAMLEMKVRGVLDVPFVELDQGCQNEVYGLNPSPH